VSARYLVLYLPLLSDINTFCSLLLLVNWCHHPGLASIDW